MYEARFFPGASLSRAGVHVAGPARHRHPVAMLAVLSAYPRSEVQRDKLLSLLWPDRDTQAARRLLSEALYVLRCALGKDAIVSVGDSLALNTERVWTDVVAFQQALNAGDRRAAVALYRGPFLDGFHVDGSTEFESWQRGRRQDFEGLYEESVYALADEAEAQGDVVEAIRWLRGRVAQDPLSSHATHRLMRMLVRTGERARALQLARSHGELLREELGILPAPCVAKLQAALTSPGPVDPQLLRVCGTSHPRCSS